MSKKTLREISYEYARERGGGLPLTAEELCNCVVLWVQQYVEETPAKVELKAQDIVGLLEGSETIVVDLNEAGDAIEIHLDGEVLNKIERAILQPISNPTSPSIPVVQTNGSLAYVPLSLVKDVKLFRHEIILSNPSPSVATATLIVVSTETTTITNTNADLLKYISIIAKFAKGRVTDFQGYPCNLDISGNYCHVAYYHDEMVDEYSFPLSAISADIVTEM